MLHLLQRSAEPSLYSVRLVRFWAELADSVQHRLHGLRLNARLMSPSLHEVLAPRRLPVAPLKSPVTPPLSKAAVRDSGAIRPVKDVGFSGHCRMPPEDVNVVGRAPHDTR